MDNAQGLEIVERLRPLNSIGLEPCKYKERRFFYQKLGLVP